MHRLNFLPTLVPSYRYFTQSGAITYGTGGDYYKPDYPRPRIRITDSKGIIKDRIPITDLAFGSLFHYSLKKAKDDCEKALRSIREELKSKKIYLRLGLARPYGNIPEPYKGWCALQVNGFHTFPDLYDREYAAWIRLE